MKLTPLSLIVLSLLVGGTSAAITAKLVAGSGGLEQPASPDAETILTRAQLEQAVEERTRELTLELAELEERLTLAERRPLAETRQPASGYATQEELEALREELLALLETESPRIAKSEEFKLQVGDALSAIRKEERVSKVRAGQEKAAANIEGQVAKLTDWLSLDSYQQDQFREGLAAKHQRDAELIQMWEDGTDNEVLGEVKRFNQEQDRAAMEAILTPQQLEIYQSAREGRGK